MLTLVADIKDEPFGLLIIFNPNGSKLCLWPGCVEGIYPDILSQHGFECSWPRFTIIQFSLSLCHCGAAWKQNVLNFRIHGYGDTIIYSHRHETTNIVRFAPNVFFN